MPNHALVHAAADELAIIFNELEDQAAVSSFLKDLCTPAELIAMIERWRVVALLESGVPYREAANKAGVSVTTVGRVARALQYGTGGYQVALGNLKEVDDSDG